MPTFAQLSNIPRNNLLGTFADLLQAGKDNTGVVGDFLLGKAPEVLNNMSYGFNPTQGKGMTYGMKPEAADLLNVLPTATLAGILGKSYAKFAGKQIAKQVQNGTGMLGRNMMNPRMNITPFEQNHLTAQKNAIEMLGLPANNTAMDRAKAMGFDTDKTFYHGTRSDIPAFDKSKIGSRFDYSFGTHTTNSPNEASIYADSDDMINSMNQWNPRASTAKDVEKGANVMPLLANDSKAMIYRTDHPAASMASDLDRSDVIGKIDDFESVLIKAKSGNQNFIALNPNQLRSRFAAFDPARRNEADLLGYSTPEMMGALAAGSGAGMVANRYDQIEQWLNNRDKR